MKTNNSATNPSLLGRVVADYKSSRAQIIKIVIIALICGGVALIFFTAAILDTQNGLAGKIGFSVIGALFSLPVIAGFYTLLSRRGSSVSLYENGLVYRRGGKDFVTTWDEIASYTEFNACRIEKKNGEAFDFGASVNGFEEIAERVKQETLSRILPQVKAAIINGSSVQFRGLRADEQTTFSKALNKTLLGSEGFTVDARGITYAEDGQRIEWPDVVDFGVYQIQEHSIKRLPFFGISSASVSFRMTYGALPNAHVLLALCEEMAGHKQASASGA